MKKLLLATVLSLIMLPTAATAEPVLQLYIQGATYDSASETWVISGATTFNLWAIANLNGPASGGVFDVKLAVAYEDGSGATVSLTPTTTGGFGGFTDSSTPGSPTLLQTVTNGDAPKTGDGADLPSHGIYGSGTDWTEYGLGDFTATDSPCGDFITSLPTPGGTNCQINVYTVTITGGTSDWIHFDLYDHYTSTNKAGQTRTSYVNAPFSHDGESVPPTNQVPEPGTVMLLGSGLLGLIGVGRSLRK